MNIGDLVEVKLEYSITASEGSLWEVWDAKDLNGNVMARLYCSGRYRPCQQNLLLESKRNLNNENQI